MTDEEQEARSMKFEATGTVNLRRLSTGRWAMYQIGGVGSPFWIGDFSDLERAYDERPAPKPHERPSYTSAKPAAKIKGLDLTKVEFKL